MQEFYRKALVALILLVVADVLLACFFVYQSYLAVRLLPADDGAMRWRYATHLDAAEGGTSTMRIADARRDALKMDFTLADTARYPYVDAELALVDDKGGPALVDLSKYSTVTFVARCAPENAMIFGIATFDEKISRPGEFLTYPSPLTFFSCSEGGSQVALDLTRLTIPQWWFESLKLGLSHQSYRLNRVAKLFFATSQQSPHNVASHAEISEVTLHGRDYRYLHVLAVLLPASWLVFGAWFFRTHARALVASLDCKLKKDLALAAYRQLTLEPYRDREKASILRFIATNYTNAELDLDGVAAATATSRNKVNEVLKTELGMTFTSYLNKLRLAEAARLLTANGAATVAEVAYGVGYGHVSYFNRLFKEEYDCTPTAFRTLAAQRDAPPAPAAPEIPPPLESYGAQLLQNQ